MTCYFCVKPGHQKKDWHARKKWLASQDKGAAAVDSGTNECLCIVSTQGQLPRVHLEVRLRESDAKMERVRSVVDTGNYQLRTVVKRTVDAITESVPVWHSGNRRPIGTARITFCPCTVMIVVQFTDLLDICFSDHDECSTSQEVCPKSVSQCVNTIGSYLCQCKRGFYHNQTRLDCTQPGELTIACGWFI